jgi:hypothetical protein
VITPVAAVIPVVEAVATPKLEAAEPVVVQPAPVAVAPARSVAAAPQPKLAPLPAPPEPEAVPATTAAPVANMEASAPAASAEPAAVVPAAVPERLTREQVAAGFDALRPALEQCASGANGLVEIDAAIAGSGRVAHAVIGGTFVGTPEGSCMARAVRAARFPESAQARMSVHYPISL